MPLCFRNLPDIHICTDFDQICYLFPETVNYFHYLRSQVNFLIILRNMFLNSQFMSFIPLFKIDLKNNRENLPMNLERNYL
jgi:hypothetical protein